MLMQSVGVGTVLTLLGQSTQSRDPGLSTAAREAAIAAISGDPAAPRHAGPALPALATTMRASLSQTSALTPGERLLLHELLARIANPLEYWKIHALRSTAPRS